MIRNIDGLRVGAPFKFKQSLPVSTLRTFKLFRESSVPSAGIAGETCVSITQIRAEFPGAIALEAKNVLPRLKLWVTLHELEQHFQPGSAAPLRFAPMVVVSKLLPTAMSLSAKGVDFLFRIEAQKGVSDRLHWPKGASGVTLGPGYDMKERSKQSIIIDMIAIGLSKAVAETIGAAAGLSGGLAENFVKDNKAIVSLSDDKQKALLKMITPRPYEGYIKKYIKIPLAQNEYDALTSFCCNPGKSVVSVMDAINEGKIDVAMTDVKSRNISGGTVVNGLSNRREKEIELFTKGIY